MLGEEGNDFFFEFFYLFVGLIDFRYLFGKVNDNETIEINCYMKNAQRSVSEEECQKCDQKVSTKA